MQAFLFGVWVVGEQVQVVCWLLASSSSGTTPGDSVSVAVLAPVGCHHPIPGDMEGFVMVGLGRNITAPYGVPRR